MTLPLVLLTTPILILKILLLDDIDKKNEQQKEQKLFTSNNTMITIFLFMCLVTTFVWQLFSARSSCMLSTGHDDDIMNLLYFRFNYPVDAEE